MRWPSTWYSTSLVCIADPPGFVGRPWLRCPPGERPGRTRSRVDDHPDVGQGSGPDRSGPEGVDGVLVVVQHAGLDDPTVHDVAQQVVALVELHAVAAALHPGDGDG